VIDVSTTIDVSSTSVLIAFFQVNLGWSVVPLAVFFHWFWKKIMGDSWHMYFCRPNNIPLCQPTVSKQWRKLKARIMHVLWFWCRCCGVPVAKSPYLILCSFNTVILREMALLCLSQLSDASTQKWQLCVC